VIGALAALVAVASALESTAGRPPARPRATEHDAAEAVRRLVPEVAALRGLPPGRSLGVRVLGHAAMASTWEALQARRARPGEAEAERALEIAFGFVPSARPGPAGAAVADGVARGFYDSDSRTLYLERERDGAIVVPVAAHEIVHALQAERHGPAALWTVACDDERLARAAAIEGDARLVELLEVARLTGRPAEALLAEAREHDRFPGESLLRDASPALHATWRTRARTRFPYDAGLDFVHELYRAGGFALVDRMLSRPPLSTSEVLHPQRYLDGHGAAPLAVPVAPAGFHVVASGRLGELGIRTLFAQLLDDPEAPASVAAGWAGDAYAVVAGGGGRLGLRWSTAWDGVEEARRFEAALAALSAWWRLLRGSAGGPGSPLADGSPLVRRDGRRVVVVRGLGAVDPASLAASLLDVAERPPAPSPPLPGVLLAAPLDGSALAPSARGLLGPGGWQSDRLALRASVPRGFRASTRTDHELLVERDAPWVTVGMLNHLEPPHLADDQLLATTVAHLVSAAGGRPGAGTLRHEPVRLAGLDGRALAWGADDSGLAVRVVLVPVCGGRSAWQLIELWQEAGGQQALAEWERSFRRTADRAPACDAGAGDDAAANRPPEPDDHAGRGDHADHEERAPPPM
jgi:hypothetical protein